MKLDIKPLKTWKAVARPVPKQTLATIMGSKPPAIPPKVAPKKGGKVYVYVYDSEPEYQGRTEHQNRVEYPGRLEYQQRNADGNSKRHNRTKHKKQTIREQAQKAGKGFKVLADVTPNVRSSSRGGRMFVKQRQRMEKFTKESPNIAPSEEEELRRKKQLAGLMGVTDSWATPWNMATTSPSAVKYVPARRLVVERSRGGKNPLGFMPHPPPLWRAKVEQNYPPTNGPNINIFNTPATNRFNFGRVTTLAEQPTTERPESAPPMQSPDDDFYEAMSPPIYGYDENINDGYYSEYEPASSRPSSVILPAATIRFNAKQYYTAPHRPYGLRNAAKPFTTTPYVQRDFNARPKGWHRNY